MKNLLAARVPIGARSLLYGVHCWFIHPIFVGLAWKRLYGFPWDPRLWVAFLVHDWGYFPCHDMDGPEGETHVLLGARIMHRLFDRGYVTERVDLDPDDLEARNRYVALDYTWEYAYRREGEQEWTTCYAIKKIPVNTWHDFCLYHSRYYAKKHGAQPSKLCMADKLSVVLEPWWLYLSRARASGELREYMANARARAESNEQLNDEERGLLLSDDPRLWYEGLQMYMIRWTEHHKSGAEDTWTASLKQ